MIIDTQVQLVECCRRWREQPAIFVDTEFISESRYYAELGTIQVGIPEQAALIDVLAVPDLSPFVELLIDPGIEKVFHAATQDLAIFYRLFNQVTDPIFDTQVASALLGSDEQISFANIVERATGTKLAKSHTFTDWLRRPLSAGQIEYALDDVRYLVPVHAYLVRELRAKGRLDWAREEFSRLEDVQRYLPTDPQEQFTRMRGVDRLRGRALAILRELAAWREETARAENLPPGRVARDEVLFELSHRPRETVKELRDVRGLAPQQVDRFGKGLLDAMQRGLSAPYPSVRRSTSLSPSLEPTVDFLMLCLRSLASELSISAGMVATRSELTQLVLAGDQADIPLMRGWRRQAVGDALLATLDGKATARILPNTRLVHLDWHGEI